MTDDIARPINIPPPLKRFTILYLQFNFQNDLQLTYIQKLVTNCIIWKQSDDLLSSERTKEPSAEASIHLHTISATPIPVIYITNILSGITENTHNTSVVVY